MRGVIVLICLAAGVAGLYWLNSFTRGKSGKNILEVAGQMPLTVQLAQPVQRDIVRIVQAPGEVEAFLEVDISAEVVAKILEMPVEEGTVVRKGDLLCRLDDADYRARLRQAEANVEKIRAAVAQSEADLEKAQRDLARQKELAEKDATSALELADYKTAQLRMKAALDIRQQELIEAESMLEAARQDLEKTIITSPIDGIVAQRFAKAGEVVVMGTMNNAGTRIMVICDLSKMQVRCRVDEADIPHVKEGQPAKIFLQSDLYTGIAGHVYRVASKGTRAMGRDVVTFETLIMVDHPDARIKPGMNANVEIEVQRRKQALTIPVQAVVQRKRKDLPEHLVAEAEAARKDAGSVTASENRRQAEHLKVVYCRNRDKAEVRLIQTGISDETSVEVTSGLGAEDWVVIGPFRSLDQIRHDAPIRVEEDKSRDAVKPSDAKSASVKDNVNNNAATNANAGPSDSAGSQEPQVASTRDEEGGT